MEGGWNWLRIVPAFGISAIELSCTTREPIEPFLTGTETIFWDDLINEDLRCKAFAIEIEGLCPCHHATPCQICVLYVCRCADRGECPTHSCGKRPFYRLVRKLAGLPDVMVERNDEPFMNVTTCINYMSQGTWRPVNQPLNTLVFDFSAE